MQRRQTPRRPQASRAHSIEASSFEIDDLSLVPKLRGGNAIAAVEVLTRLDRRERVLVILDIFLEHSQAVT